MAWAFVRFWSPMELCVLHTMPWADWCFKSNLRNSSDRNYNPTQNHKCLHPFFPKPGFELLTVGFPSQRTTNWAMSLPVQIYLISFAVITRGGFQKSFFTFWQKRKRIHLSQGTEERFGRTQDWFDWTGYWFDAQRCAIQCGWKSQLRRIYWTYQKETERVVGRNPVKNVEQINLM